MTLSLETLEKAMPRLPHLRAAGLLPHLNAALEEFEINTPERVTAFLAQIAHESAQLRHFEELDSGYAYEGREDLGNVHPGDGQLFKGRGPIQLTGRKNYRNASKALGVDLIARPQRASDADVAFRVAGWFWKRAGCNELADAGSFDEITRRINGGLNGQEDRLAHFSRAKAALGVG